MSVVVTAVSMNHVLGYQAVFPPPPPPGKKKTNWEWQKIFYVCQKKKGV